MNPDYPDSTSSGCALEFKFAIASNQIQLQERDYGLRAPDGVGVRHRAFCAFRGRKRSAPAATANLVSRRAGADRPIWRHQDRVRNGGHEFLQAVVRL